MIDVHADRAERGANAEIDVAIEGCTAGRGGAEDADAETGAVGGDCSTEGGRAAGAVEDIDDAAARTLQSSVGALQRSAAASTSMVRAAAPTLRSLPYISRTEALPPVAYPGEKIP